MKRLITSFFCIITFITFTNASTYYVDGTNGIDTNNGTSWATARKTITAANSLAGVGDNIYIKAGTYNFSSSAYGTPALSMKVDVNYYGGFAGLDTETPATRQTSDLDGNGIVESWEFSNPTILNFTITTGGVGLSFSSSNTAVRSFNGFKITGTSSFRNTDKNSRCIALYSNMLFENNTTTNWVVTGDFMGVYMKAFFFGIEPGVNNVTVNNCLFEKNEVNVNSTLADYLLDTFIRLGAATGVRGNVMSNCIVRNNKVKVDYSTSSVTSCNNIRGVFIAMFAQTTAGYPTTLKNCIVHNNDMTYVPNGTALIASNGAVISVYDAGVACYDSIINCTVANNRAIKMGTGGMYLRFSSASQPYHIVLNNVFYNNTKDGIISNFIASNGSPTGVIRIANNYANGGSVTNYSTTVVGNVNDLSATNTDATKGAFFSAPSSGQGYITDGTVETSRWTIGSSSYLKGKGVSLPNAQTDKGGVIFASTPSVGAYEGGDIIVTSSRPQIISQTSSLTSITVNPGGKLTLNQGVILSVGTLNLQSDNSGTATFLDKGGVLNSATTNVQQYLSSIRNWYISSPITNATTPSNYTFYRYREPGDNIGYSSQSGSPSLYWESLPQGSSLEVARGYIASPSSAPVTLTFSGSLNTGNITTGALTRTTNASKKGFNLVGNPYISYLNLATLDTTKVWGSYWIRSRNSSDTAYDFDTYNLTSGLGISKSGKSVTNIIPPMQAFWVRVKESQGPTTLTFTNSMREHINNSNNVFRAPAVNNIVQQVLYLQVSNGINNDETVLAFNSHASNGSDEYDSPKMSINSPSIPEIYTSVGEEKFAINGMSSIPFDTEIPLGFTTNQSGNFSIKASQIINFDSLADIYLKDNNDLVNTPVLLTRDNPYNFSSDPTTNNINRFVLIFKAPTVATETNSTNNVNIRISTNASGKIMVNGNLNAETLVVVYNEVGQEVISKSLTQGNIQSGISLQAGVYIVAVTSLGKKVTQKVIVK